MITSLRFAANFYLSPSTPLSVTLQLHDHSEPLLPPVHGAGLGLLCVHDGERHRAGEGAAPEGDPQSHGGQQRGHLVHELHRQLHHDDHEHGAAHLHRHGETRGEVGMRLLRLRVSLVFIEYYGALLWRIFQI